MASWAPSYAMASRAPSSAMAAWAPSSAMASRAPSSAMAAWAPSSAMASWAPSSAMASELSVPLWSAHPPSPVELSRLSGGGSNVSPLSCVSCVPASCVHIWFVSCPRLVWWLNSMSLSMFQPCLCDYVLITLCILVHACSVWFRLVYSLLPRCILSLSPALSCLVLPWCLIKDYYLSLCPRLRVPVPPLCVHRDTIQE